MTDYFTCHDGLTKSPNFKNERNIINDDRLDKLSLKLENFIKQNSKRL